MKQEKTISIRLKQFAPQKFYSLSKALRPYLFLLPAASVLALIFLYPMLRAIYVSLFNYDQLLRLFEFVGLQNYVEILSDAYFWNSLRRSAIWVVGSVAGQFFIGFAFALLLHERWPGNRFVRSLILIPWVMPGASIGLGWRMIYNDQFGMFNDIFNRLGLPTQTWLANPSLAMFSVILANVWKAFPFVTVTMLAGLAAIPTDLYEAATVDGASSVKRFRYITLPSLRNLIIIITLLMVVWTFNYFDLVFILTKGGPAYATEILPILVYRYAFESFQYGYSAAIAILITLTNAIFAVFYLQMLRRAES